MVNFIAENIGTRQLSMRLLEPSLRKVAYADSQGIDWRDLVLSQLRNLGDEKGFSRSTRKLMTRSVLIWQ